jgi:hypothetical protein
LSVSLDFPILIVPSVYRLFNVDTSENVCVECETDTNDFNWVLELN